MERVVVSTAAVSLDNGCCCQHGDALGDGVLVVMQDVVAGHGRGCAGHPDIFDREPLIRSSPGRAAERQRQAWMARQEARFGDSSLQAVDVEGWGVEEPPTGANDRHHDVPCDLVATARRLAAK
jgi:hypothetical protein